MLTTSFINQGAPFGFVKQGIDVGGLVQGFHDGLVGRTQVSH